MTKIYTLLLLCLFALTLPVTAREAEFKKIKESWTLQADGTQVYRQSKVLTLYTHTAMNRTYGESFITYDPRYQTLQIHESYTRQKTEISSRPPPMLWSKCSPRQRPMRRHSMLCARW